MPFWQVRSHMRKLASRKLTVALFVFYCLALAGIVLCKTRMSFRFLLMMFNLADPNIRRSVNLIPFGGMLVLNGRADYGEILLNVLVFVPFGLFLCLLSDKRTVLHLIMPILLTSALFEVTQYLFVLGASDITDVLANTLGGMIGVGLFYLCQMALRQKTNALLNAVALVVEIGFLGLLCMVRPL